MSRSLSQVNGLKYDTDIDRAIIYQLGESELLSTGKLKEKIEMVLTRSINDRTYFNHLARLVDKKILNKQDYGQRGKVSVFYSLTEEAKMRIKLRLLKEIDPEAETFRKIFAHLLIRITEPQRGLCNGSYLDELLSEFNMSRKDLRIHHINKVEEAFALLLKNGLIRPIMNFRGETRYDLVDYELYYLMRSIRLIIDLDANVNKTKEDLWPPDYEEIEKRKLCFPDEVSLQKSLVKRELKRNVFRKKVNDPKEFNRIQKKVKAALEKSERGVLDLINRIKKDYEKPLKKYAFLSDVIGAYEQIILSLFSQVLLA